MGCFNICQNGHYIGLELNNELKMETSSCFNSHFWCPKEFPIRKYECLIFVMGIILGTVSKIKIKKASNENAESLYLYGAGGET